MLENEEGETAEEAYYQACLFQDQEQDQYQGKPSSMLAAMLLIHIYHALFNFWSFTKIEQKLFLLGYYY